jgi:DNA polymerase IIIc chi subunit
MNNTESKEPLYTVQKDKVMKAATENFLIDLRGKLEAMNYKFANNTRVFDSELEYLQFCRKQINATTLKMMAFNIEMDSI